MCHLSNETLDYRDTRSKAQINTENSTKCPDGITRECCYDEKEHKFIPPENKVVVTDNACSICVALKEKVEFWKNQFGLEVAGRRSAEAELEKVKQSVIGSPTFLNKL